MHAYIIEHMEPDEVATPKSLPPWVQLEYRQISKAYTNRRVVFSNLTKATAASLEENLNDISEDKSIACLEEGVQQLMDNGEFKHDRICLLDPKAEQELSPEDDERFDAFLFGGILGDDPPRDRTAELRKLGFPSRHLGSVQMTTDTAVAVTVKVINDKTKLQDLPHVDHPTINFNKNESVDMPFRYLTDESGKPILPKGMFELLRDDMDKSFDF